MIFVNYGSGAYKVLQHVPWHGITLADFVFPWFLWIMGFSIPLSTNSLLKRDDTKRLKIFQKIFVRTLKMFAIGIMLNSRFGVELSKLRIFGVLQRIALCYFFVATMELLLYRKIKVDSNTNNVIEKKIFVRLLNDYFIIKIIFFFILSKLKKK
jgi:heparan-alpha-glucosaminide N-acetyltransferase